MITSAHILPKMKPYAIALSWLGMQAPTKEVRVVLEVDEGMYNYFYVCSPDPAAKYHLASASLSHLLHHLYSYILVLCLLITIQCQATD